MTTVSLPMLTEAVPDHRAWRGPSLSPDRYLVRIPDECVAEMESVLAELRRAPVPTLLLLPEHFALDACARWMKAVRARLDEGPGFVVLDRLPLDRMSRQEAIDLYWLLGNLLEPPVAQEWKGTVIYDVRHDGEAYGANTRGALTPVGLEMHNDSSMGEAPPNYVSAPVPGHRPIRRHEHRVERARRAQPLPARATRAAPAALRAVLPRSPGIPGGRRRRDQLPPRLRLGRPAPHALQCPPHLPRLREDRAACWTRPAPRP